MGSTLEVTLTALNSLNVQLTLIAAIFCGVIKHRSGTWFGLSLFTFYFLSLVLEEWFKAGDPLHIWRYVRWTLFDLMFLSWLCFLVNRKCISIYTLCISALIELVAICALMIRMLDGFYSGATLTTPYFGLTIWATNTCYVVLAFSPVLQFIVRRSLKCN